MAVARELEVVTGVPPDGVFLVAGDRFPDALAAAAAAGRAGRPLLLSANRTTLTAATVEHLSANTTIDRIDIVGDATVISDGTVDAAIRAASSADR